MNKSKGMFLCSATKKNFGFLKNREIDNEHKEHFNGNSRLRHRVGSVHISGVRRVEESRNAGGAR